jgi:hypothetical protein
MMTKKVSKRHGRPEQRPLFQKKIKKDTWPTMEDKRGQKVHSSITSWLMGVGGRYYLQGSARPVIRTTGSNGRTTRFFWLQKKWCERKQRTAGHNE